MTEPYKIILADDHATLRNGIKSVLEETGDYRVIAEAEDGVELLALLNRNVVPDTLIIDLSMPGLSGIEAIDKIRKMGYGFKILVLTMHKEPELICRTFSAGCNGYLIKDSIAAELWSALSALLEGKIYIADQMQQQLPNDCRMKVFSGQKPPSTETHCGKASSGPLLTYCPAGN